VALILETGAGFSDSDTFAEVTTIDAYAAKFGLTFSGTTQEKEIAARKGTQYISIAYQDVFAGQRTFDTQAQAWPRWGVTDSDGFSIASNIVPQAVIDAACEASILARVEELLPDISNPGNLASKSVQVGPISKSESWVSGRGQFKLYRRIELLLDRYCTDSTKLVRS